MFSRGVCTPFDNTMKLITDFLTKHPTLSALSRNLFAWCVIAALLPAVLAPHLWHTYAVIVANCMIGFLLVNLGLWVASKIDAHDATQDAAVRAALIVGVCFVVGMIMAQGFHGEHQNAQLKEFNDTLQQIDSTRAAR